MNYCKTFIVDPDQKLKLKLKHIDPAFKGDFADERAALVETEICRRRLSHLQRLLYAEKKHSVLIVLQAMDAGGKDGAINHVFTALNAQGAIVSGFKQPTPDELAHDFLWRVHPHAPAKGWFAIFNRSHYESVLVERVHKLVDKSVWTRRYDRIREFEILLRENSTLILKFFLHISRSEQLSRFEQRLDDPGRNWKISESDYTERELWDDYMEAFEDAINATSAPHAPWYVIPSNHKWFRNLAVSRIVAESLEALDMSFPKPAVDLAVVREKYHAAVAEELGSDEGKAKKRDKSRHKEG